MMRGCNLLFDSMLRNKKLTACGLSKAAAEYLATVEDPVEVQEEVQDILLELQTSISLVV